VTAQPPPPPPAAGTAYAPRVWLTAKLCARANVLVNDLVVGMTKRANTEAFLSEDHVTSLRVLVGIALREASAWGRQYQHTLESKTQPPPKLPAIKVPKVIVTLDATTTEDPGYDSEKTTEPWHRPTR
jgi:hypothetical protein